MEVYGGSLGLWIFKEWNFSGTYRLYHFTGIIWSGTWVETWNSNNLTYIWMTAIGYVLQVTGQG